MLEKSASLQLLNDQAQAAVQLTVTWNNEEYEIFVMTNGMARRRFHLDSLTVSDMNDIGTRLRSAVQGLASSINNQDRATESASLKKLAQEGKRAFKKLFPDSSSRRSIRNALTEPAVIQVLFDKYSAIPWDMLYDDGDGNFIGGVDPTNFWGLRHVVSRVMTVDYDGDFPSPEITSDLPRVGLIKNSTLNHVQSIEEPMLDALKVKKAITLETLPPLISSQSPSENQDQIRLLVEFLTRPYDVFHFACHAFQRDSRADVEARKWLVIDDQFDVEFADCDVCEFSVGDHAFVILNACRSGIDNPFHTSHWVGFFGNRGARGIIATEFYVPDEFAANFIERFYSHFLQGEPVGVSLLSTRQEFLETETTLTKGVLGLAYALYSTPSIRIRRRI